jgi:glycosyltransferase involved in cell wall biosynthesis
MNPPKLSLITPCFNSSSTLERTIQSVAVQSYPNLQWILMDGGSKDATMAIVQKYANLFHKIVSEPDGGQTNALNKGFRFADGEIFGWLCADDELTPDTLAFVSDYFQQHPDVDVLTGGCARVFSDGMILNTEPQPHLWERIGYHNGIEQPSTFWRAKLHRACGELDESMYYSFDWDWWNRMRKAGGRIATTPRILSKYHFSENNKTSTGARKLILEMYRTMKRHAPLRGYLADIYLFLYLRFDLHGYYDRPPACGKLRSFLFKHVIRTLLKIFGKELIYSYNWNFASKQERGIPWWK